MAGNQQNKALSDLNCPLQRLVDRSPCLVKVAAVQVQHSVRFDRTGPQAAIPARVQRPSRKGFEMV